MSELFYDASSIDYPIVDADSHVNEPPELWQDRVPAKFKTRAPKVLSTERGEFWSFEDGKELWPVGLTAVAGLSYLEYKPFGMTYAKMRPGSFDTKERLRDMDADGIYAQILYPSVTLKGASVYSGERELQLCCVRSYNEWLAEFCEGSGGRLIGQGIIPTTGLDDAVAELDWSLKTGHRGIVISSFPNGSLDPQPEDERFWGLAQEASVPVAVHIGSFLPAGMGRRKEIDWKSLRFLGMAAWTKAGGQTLGVVCDLIFAGIYDRFPQLKIVLVEANIGWIPTLLEQADDMYRRYRWYSGAVDKMKLMPSEIFMRHFWATFMLDSVGVEMRHRMNLRHIMWSTDYPHSGSDWPDSRVTLERVFRGVPRSEVKLMIHTNCKQLYGLDYIPDALEL
ncbi:MAG: amidohydrolase family protein [Myxococcales bacterium]|nr:amidohydrolase family protein [Myxococcales bacterium]